MKYKVLITQIEYYHHEVVIDAASPQDAKEKAFEACEHNEYAHCFESPYEVEHNYEVEEV